MIANTIGGTSIHHCVVIRRVVWNGHCAEMHQITVRARMEVEDEGRCVTSAVLPSSLQHYFYLQVLILSSIMSFFIMIFVLHGKGEVRF